MMWNSLTVNVPLETGLQSLYITEVVFDTYLHMYELHVVEHVVGHPLPLLRLPHDNVDDGVLHEGGEHEQGAGGHEYVDGLDVGDGGQGLLGLSVLGGQGEQGGDAQGDPGGYGVGPNPERDPGHDDDEAGRDVGVEQVVSQAAL
ncbi:hypothetical protein AVEN_113380-1 [Araneus ventricosus]|uniref:Uncharacterized protein n=1 Tax=Araneus ventricosus TaxID=182803 RepID=A0A4Y2I9P9_ARAVE|nr:hypothetical protein AVEN_113380-1 [Araneus ventricosus]